VNEFEEVESFVSKAEQVRKRAAELAAVDRKTEKRQEIMWRVGVTVVTFVIVGVLITVGVAAGKRKNPPPGPAPTTVAGDIALPKGVNGETFAVETGAMWGAGKPNVPVMTLWEDFQCPACQKFNTALGNVVTTLSDNDVKLERNVTSFLDDNFPESNGSSARAGNAYGCALDQNKGEEFFRVIYANQPTREGTGYTNDTLKTFGQLAGVKNLTEYDKCVDTEKYKDWVTNSQVLFLKSNIPGTPSVLINGKLLTPDGGFSEKYLREQIVNATPAD
jgi:protein-disulfide isomerase